MIDASKAFDRLCHSKLFELPETYNVRISRMAALLQVHSAILPLFHPLLSGLRQVIQICLQYAIEYYIVVKPCQIKFNVFQFSISSDKPYIKIIPKNGLKQGTFCNEFNDYLEKLSCMNGTIVIVGDFNIDWLNTNGPERK